MPPSMSDVHPATLPRSFDLSSDGTSFLSKEPMHHANDASAPLNLTLTHRTRPAHGSVRPATR